MIRLRVIASSAVVRAGLETLLREDPRLLVLSKPGDGGRAREHEIDVVLIEIAEFTRDRNLTSLAHSHSGHSTPFVLLADDLGRAEIRRALQAGMRALLPRAAAGTQIIAAIEAVAAGLMVLGSEEMDLLLPPVNDSPYSISPGEPLTSRELEILGLLGEGMANKDIAAQLQISEHTVKFHVSSILAKLGAGNRSEAVARGIREGLILI